MVKKIKVKMRELHNKLEKIIGELILSAVVVYELLIGLILYKFELIYVANLMLFLLWMLWSLRKVICLCIFLRFLFKCLYRCNDDFPTFWRHKKLFLVRKTMAKLDIIYKNKYISNSIKSWFNEKVYLFLLRKEALFETKNSEHSITSIIYDEKEVFIKMFYESKEYQILKKNYKKKDLTPFFKQPLNLFVVLIYNDNILNEMMWEVRESDKIVIPFLVPAIISGLNEKGELIFINCHVLTPYQGYHEIIDPTQKEELEIYKEEARMRFQSKPSTYNFKYPWCSWTSWWKKKKLNKTK